MRVLVQWAKRTPADWEAVEVRSLAHVQALARRAVPRGGEKLDNKPGWYCALNCQGIVFSGYDHVAIEPLQLADGLRITGWCDDPEDHGDTRWATQWDLHHPAPDPALSGAVNTVQQRTVWATPDAAEWFGGYGPHVRAWESFTPPPADLTRHGVWLDDSLWHEHQAARSTHGWREWIR